MNETSMTAEDFDKLCDEGFNKLDELRQADKVKTPEYSELLYKLRDLTRKRMAKVGLFITPLK